MNLVHNKSDLVQALCQLGSCYFPQSYSNSALISGQLIGGQQSRLLLQVSHAGWQGAGHM